MNRLRNTLDGTLNKQHKAAGKPSGSGLKLVSTNTMVNSFDMQMPPAKQQMKQKELCAQATAAQPPSTKQSINKKRTAFENISNAPGALNCSNTSVASKETTKKSRVAVYNGAEISVKRTESLYKKASNAMQFKENSMVCKTSGAVTKKVIKDQMKLISSKVTKTTTMTTTTVTSRKPLVTLKKSQLTAPKKEAPELGLNNSSSDKSTFASTESLSRNLELIDLENAAKEDSEKLEEMTWEDIDADDKDEFNSNDYVEHIFEYYRQRENQFTIDDYITRQPALNKQMRHLLVDWMVEVQQQLEFNHEVLYLSVKLLDLYLKNQPDVQKEKLQLIGGAAMFIACKFEERIAPIIEDFIYVSDNAYTREELIKMEIDILKMVRFDIGAPLSYTFLRRYSKCVKADMRFLTLARYILELSLQDYNFCHISDSHKACASLYLALRMTVAYEKTLNTDSFSEEDVPIISSANLTATEWNATLDHYTGSKTSEFIQYLPLMNNLLKVAPASKYKTIFKKYSHQVFYEVAKIAPLVDSEIDDLLQQNEN